ncbi:MAG: peptidylprolyl isomerase [Candidatus Omnitrophota bacterium]|nr:peptidylprolyl isomerase [Candidatus Omnitrophota bacterium]
MAKQVITFHYELKSDDGKLLDSSLGEEPISFLQGTDQIIPGLEEALLNLKQGAKEKIYVAYQDAYGPYDQTLVAKVPRSQFPPDPIKVGDVFQIKKNGDLRVISVMDVASDMITIDANHPMAGKNLTFHVEIVGRRDATPEEINHGHIHDPNHPHSH